MEHLLSAFAGWYMFQSLVNFPPEFQGCPTKIPNQLTGTLAQVPNHLTGDTELKYFSETFISLIWQTVIIYFFWFRHGFPTPFTWVIVSPQLFHPIPIHPCSFQLRSMSGSLGVPPMHPQPSTQSQCCGPGSYLQLTRRQGAPPLRGLCIQHTVLLRNRTIADTQ